MSLNDLAAMWFKRLRLVAPTLLGAPCAALLLSVAIAESRRIHRHSIIVSECWAQPGHWSPARFKELTGTTLAPGASAYRFGRREPARVGVFVDGRLSELFPSD